MARDIDWSEPLSDEDRAWAEQRMDMTSGRDGMTIGEQIQLNDEKFGKKAKDAQKSRAERKQELLGIISDAQNEVERLDREQAEEDNRNAALAGSLGDQARGLSFRDQTPVNGEAPEGAIQSSEDYSDERKWNKAALQTEIDNRNQDRVQEGLPPIARNGTRSELVERLRQDDEELASGE